MHEITSGAVLKKAQAVTKRVIRQIQGGPALQVWTVRRWLYAKGIEPVLDRAYATHAGMGLFSVAQRRQGRRCLAQRRATGDARI